MKSLTCPSKIQNSYMEGQGHNMGQKKKVQIIDHETLYRKQIEPPLLCGPLRVTHVHNPVIIHERGKNHEIVTMTTWIYVFC